MSDRVMIGFNVDENIVDQREVSGATKFKDKNEIRRIGVAKIRLARSVVEDFFGHERI